MSGESFSRYQPDPVSVMMRRSCSDCGKGGLEWMAPNALLSRVSESQRSRVHEGIGFSGPDGDAWLCPGCGAFGLMGPSNFG